MHRPDNSGTQLAVAQGGLSLLIVETFGTEFHTRDEQVPSRTRV